MQNPQIQNIVCTCNLGSALYLQGLAQRLEVCEYNPDRFAAVTFRLKYPKSTALIFSSGKLVCTGCKSKNEARLALLYYVHVIQQRMSLDVGIYEFEVQNMVASAYLGHTICLTQLFLEYNKESSYEPELFPGLIFRQIGCPVVFLVFDSGRIVLTGAKEEGLIHEAWAMIVPVLETIATKPSLDLHTLDKRVAMKKEDLAILRSEEWGPMLDGLLEQHVRVPHPLPEGPP